jgi:hypothetical protein
MLPNPSSKSCNIITYGIRNKKVYILTFIVDGNDTAEIQHLKGNSHENDVEIIT